MRKKLALVLTVMLVCSCLLSGFAVRTDWTDNQNKAHQIADIAREMGLPENDPIILRAKDIWYDEESKKTASDPIPEEIKEATAEVIQNKPQEDPVSKKVIEDLVEAQLPTVDSNDLPAKKQYEYTPEQEDAFVQAAQDELKAMTNDMPVRYTKGIENYTQQDIDIVASVVYNEAAHRTTERHKELVAACVVNRVNSPWLGNTVYEVVCWPGQYLPAYAQYGSWYMNRAMESEMWPHLCEIAEKALRGEVDIPYDVVGQAEFIQGRGVYETHYTDYSVTYFCYSMYPFDDPMLSLLSEAA